MTIFAKDGAELSAKEVTIIECSVHGIIKQTRYTRLNEYEINLFINTHLREKHS